MQNVQLHNTIWKQYVYLWGNKQDSKLDNVIINMYVMLFIAGFFK